MLPEVITASAGKDSHPTWNAGMFRQITKILLSNREEKMNLMIYHMNKYKLLDSIKTILKYNVSFQ
jgi:hypothetical protein